MCIEANLANQGENIRCSTVGRPTAQVRALSTIAALWEHRGLFGLLADLALFKKGQEFEG